jgi:RimJ/RimL family protein N-acetyltransferase
VQLLISNEETPIGMIGLEPISQEAGVTEVGYWIVPECWGEGFGTEATELIVEYAFDRLRLHKVTARAFGFNDASQRLLEKVGFTEEGVQREQIFIDGEYQDTHWYGLID